VTNIAEFEKSTQRVGHRTRLLYGRWVITGLIFLLVSSTVSCWFEGMFEDFMVWVFNLDEDSPDSQGIKTFDIELDMQTGCSPFYPYTAYEVISKFPTGSFIYFVESDDTLSADSLNVDGVLGYFHTHADKSYFGLDYDRNHYLCGIKHFFGWYYWEEEQMNIWAGYLGGLTGSSFDGTTRWSFTCVDNGIEWDANKGTILITTHELGHNIANLSHYCLDSNYVNIYEHDPYDGSCVMCIGGTTCRCTGESLVDDIHFCDSCVARILRAAIHR